MKKLFVILITGLLILLSTYVFIPNIITLKAEERINVTQKGLHRMLLDNENVKKWWPGETKTAGIFSYNGSGYQFVNNNISLLAVTVNNGDRSINTSFYIVSIKKDSVYLAWVGKAASSYNPFKRFSIWLKTKKINGDMNTVLKKMKAFYSNDENIYGVKVQRAHVTDSILITTFLNSKEYPGTAFIYSLVDKLKNYASEGNAKETSYPMLNIEKTDTAGYLVRVALPVDKALPNTTGISTKHMLVNSDILVTEVTGGVYRVAEAVHQTALYASDYQRAPPAISFVSLITDRRKEADTSKWITKVYFPII